MFRRRSGPHTEGDHRSNLHLLLLLAALLVFLLGFYMLAVEPYWIEVTHHHVEAPLDRPIKIAHLSDLHSKGVGRREKKLLALLEEEKPDLIVITGDSRSTFGGNHKMIRETFASLRAPLGVWVVRGNHDNPWFLQKEAGFGEIPGLHYLENQAQPVWDDVWLVGLDDAEVGHPDLDAALKEVPEGVFAIGLFHSPVGFDEVAGRLPLVLAGHTHGGQVRAPFLRPFWLPAGSGDYLEGWYLKKDSLMYVNRGLGTSILPIRFLCRPEVAFITVGKQKEKDDGED